MTAAMPQIKKIVWLTLENRSLDYVLGWLYRDKELSSDLVLPRGSSTRFDGIKDGACNYVRTTAYAPIRGTQDRPQPLRQPRWNPNEWWENVGNQMYDDGYGNHTVKRWSDATPPMTGFAYDYSKLDDTNEQIDEVMGAYSKQQLPALYGLAESFAVSDRWFSSVPTETNPNRAFSICGTSQGAVDNRDAVTYDALTIFNVLSSAPVPQKSWGVYYQYNGFFDMSPKWGGRCFTADIFSYLSRALDAGIGEVGNYHAFLERLKSDDLPDFTYLEPFWGGGYGLPTGDDFIGLQGNDYHSPAWVGPAEFDLNEVYNAVRRSPHWDNMLFVITFDEHGGTWDHVPPPGTVKPDHLPSIRPFEFNRMGVRVPTILVSPWVVPGTVFRAPDGSKFDFDHTSLLATILLWAGIDPRTAKLGTRVANAPTFEGVLSTTGYDNKPTFVVPAEYAKQGGEKGPHNIPFDIEGVPITTVRSLMDRAESVEQFLEWLEIVVGRLQ